LSFQDFIKVHVLPIVVPSFVVSWLQELLLTHPVIFGNEKRLHLHKTVQCNNTLFNLSSGEIFVDAGTLFAHNVMVLTGRHNRTYNYRQELVDSVPPSGYDIHIGKQVWVASGAIILGGVTIGDESTIAAGAIVTKDVPSHTMVKGIW
jgi:acetyltransferase-like isoleucine patch superfamily enzyme